ncbi:MAG: DMT family transporter [Sulfitobacter sp.]
MVAFSALVAGSFSLGSMAANEISPTALNAVRFLIASLVIGGVAMTTTGLPIRAFAASWRYCVLGGLFATYFVLMFEGLKTAKPVSLAAVFTLTPVLAGGFGWLLLRQKPTARMVLALGIGAIGALWVIFRADLPTLLAFEIGRGEVLFFLGCISHALFTPMIRKLNRGEPAIIFTFGTLVAGAILLLIFGWEDVVATQWTSLPSIVWITLFYIALFASAITFVLLQFASLRLPAAKVMAYTYLTPSWVIGWELMLGRGVPELVVFGGIGLTVVALYLLLQDDSAKEQRAN